MTLDMHRKKTSIQNILRSLKKPTKLDKIINAIPKPKGAVPSFGLPRWKDMPLESKLPLIEAPEGTYYFSRKKIGQELFIDSRNDAEFNLNDPYNYDIDYSYNPLHDEHLAKYFSKKNVMKCLIQQGFITKNSDVICSIKEYNMYRKYLKKLLNDSVKKFLLREAEINEDRRVLERVEKEAEKDYMRMKVREEKNARIDKMHHEKIREEIEKRKQREKKAAQIEERLKKIEIKKKENIKQVILKAKLHGENVKRKRAMIKDKNRQKIVKALLKIAKRDRKRRKIRRERMSQDLEYKKKIKEKKWQLRYQFQENQLKKEQFILQYASQQRDKFIEAYKKKVDEERKRIQDTIEKSTKLKKCYAARYADGGKKICCKIPKKKDVSKKIKKQALLIDDFCLMTNNCKCDEPGIEYCQDQQYLSH